MKTLFFVFSLSSAAIGEVPLEERHQLGGVVRGDGTVIPGTGTAARERRPTLSPKFPTISIREIVERPATFRRYVEQLQARQTAITAEKNRMPHLYGQYLDNDRADRLENEYEAAETLLQAIENHPANPLRHRNPTAAERMDLVSKITAVSGAAIPEP